MKPSVLRWLSLCLLLALSGLLSTQSAGAPPAPNNRASASGQARPAYVAQAREMVDAVLAEPEFDRTQIIKKPKSKEPLTQEPATQKPTTSGKSSDRGNFFAQSGEIILWLLVFVLIVLLVVYAKHWLPFLSLRRSRGKSPHLSQQSDSVLETAVALPEDIATAIARYWREGKKDEALSLLYRGTIKLLSEHYRIDLPQSATEGEMHLLVSNAIPSFKDDFGNIVRAWLRLAYAHRPPADIVGLLAGFARLQQTEGVVS
ncbi:MAG: hypothetical protein FWD67_03845 [Betaproteobacteria bacterium]|nr:hypothetical protein [Betaproteobacteria bacterium]